MQNFPKPLLSHTNAIGNLGACSLYGIRIGSRSTITHYIEIRVNRAMTRQRDDDGAMIIAQWCNDNEEMNMVLVRWLDSAMPLMMRWYDGYDAIGRWRWSNDSKAMLFRVIIFALSCICTIVLSTIFAHALFDVFTLNRLQ